MRVNSVVLCNNTPPAPPQGPTTNPLYKHVPADYDKDKVNFTGVRVATAGKGFIAGLAAVLLAATAAAQSADPFGLAEAARQKEAAGAAKKAEGAQEKAEAQKKAEEAAKRIEAIKEALRLKQQQEAANQTAALQYNGVVSPHSTNGANKAVAPAVRKKE